MSEPVDHSQTAVRRVRDRHDFRRGPVGALAVSGAVSRREADQTISIRSCVPFSGSSRMIDPFLACSSMIRL